MHHSCIPSARIEILEIRLLLTFNPSAVEQELLEHLNRFRMAPQQELDVLFSSRPDPLVATDPLVQEAIDFFEVDGAILETQWSALAAAPPLAWNEQLTDAALGHNEQMIAADLQSHQVPGEAPLGERVTAAGYDWNSVGENVYAFAQTAFETHAAFAIDWGDNPPSGIQADTGHRINLLKPEYQDVGISVVPEENVFTNVGPLVVTQDFAARNDVRDAFLLGVVYGDQNGNHRYDAGEGLGGVNLSIRSAGGTEYSVQTLAAGGYQLAVPPGLYSVRITSSDYESVPARQGVVMAGQSGFDGQTLLNHNVKVDFDVLQSGGTTLEWNLAGESLPEDDGTIGIAATLTRSGDLSQELTVYMRALDESEAATPPTVVFAAGSADSPEFRVLAIDDQILDGDVQTLLQASTLPFGESGDAGMAEVSFIVTDVEHVVAAGPAGEVSTTRPLLSWQPLEGAQDYDVKLFEAQAESVLFSWSGIGSPQFELPEALEEGDYRFQVRGRNAAGDLSQFGDPMFFTVEIPVPEAPEFRAPAALISDQTPLFEWTKPAGSTSFDLWIGLTGESTPVLRERQVMENRFETTQSLELGQYTAWVRGFNEVDEAGDWSLAHEFEIVADVPPPTVPTLLAPAARISDRTPTIEWAEVPAAARYDLWVATAGSAEPFVRELDLIDLSYTIETELDWGHYEVFLRAANSEGEFSGWTEKRTFELLPDVPVPAIPDLAENPRLTSDMSPELSWQEDVNAASFEVWVENSQGELVFHEPAAMTNSVSIEPELSTGDFQAWIRARNSEFERSAWSDPLIFTVVSDVPRPEQPVVDLPSSFISDRQPLISWSADPNAHRYQMYLGLDGQSEPVYFEQQLLDPNFRIPSDLSLGNYSVWARSFNSEYEYSLWSEPLQFSVVDDVITPTAPVFPLTVSVFSDSTPLVEWSAVEQAAWYDVYLRRAGTSSALVRDTRVPDNTYEFAQELELGDHEFWVRAFNSEGEVSPWSQMQTLTIVADVPVPVIPSLDLPHPFISDRQPGISWESDQFAARHHVFLRKVGESESLYDQSELWSPNFQISSPLALGEYDVWVRSRNTENEYSGWSQAVRFEVVEDVLTPTRPVFPLNATSASDRTPLLEWSGVEQAAWYDVWLSPVESTEALVRERRVREPRLEVPLELELGEYNVWVRAFNSEGEISDWSEVHRLFVVDDVPVPDAPTLFSIPPFSTNRTPTFEWTQVNHAQRYDLWLGLQGESNPVLRVTNVRGHSYTSPQELPNGSYKVWVRTFNSEGEASAWSDPREFTIGSDGVAASDSEPVENAASPILLAGISLNGLLEERAVSIGDRVDQIQTRESAIALTASRSRNESRNQPPEDANTYREASERQQSVEPLSESELFLVVDPEMLRSVRDRVLAEWPMRDVDSPSDAG